MEAMWKMLPEQWWAMYVNCTQERVDLSVQLSADFSYYPNQNPYSLEKILNLSDPGKSSSSKISQPDVPSPSSQQKTVLIPPQEKVMKPVNAGKMAFVKFLVPRFFDQWQVWFFGTNDGDKSIGEMKEKWGLAPMDTQHFGMPPSITQSCFHVFPIPTQTARQNRHQRTVWSRCVPYGSLWILCRSLWFLGRILSSIDLELVAHAVRRWSCSHHFGQAF